MKSIATKKKKIRATAEQKKKKVKLCIPYKEKRKRKKKRQKTRKNIIKWDEKQWYGHGRYGDYTNKCHSIVNQDLIVIRGNKTPIKVGVVSNTIGGERRKRDNKNQSYGRWKWKYFTHSHIHFYYNSTRARSRHVKTHLNV